jgi:hypothetical protein
MRKVLTQPQADPKGALVCPTGKSVCGNPKEIAFVQTRREKYLASVFRK